MGRSPRSTALPLCLHYLCSCACIFAISPQSSVLPAPTEVQGRHQVVWVYVYCLLLPSGHFSANALPQGQLSCPAYRTTHISGLCQSAPQEQQQMELLVCLHFRLPALFKCQDSCARSDLCGRHEEPSLDSIVVFRCKHPAFLKCGKTHQLKSIVLLLLE